MGNPNVIEWLQLYLKKPKIHEKSLKPVMHFSLLWNLFEYTYFTKDKRLTPDALFDLSDISFKFLEEVVINKCFNHFEQRYLNENGKTNEMFEKLRLCKKSKNDKESDYQICKKIIENKSLDRIEKIKCLFLIIHRFRNNLFHGNKKPLTLNLFENEFNHINEFLMYFIGKTSHEHSK